MTNPMINPQPNYSGVTIQIANPAVYADGMGANIRNANVYPNGIDTANISAMPQSVPQNVYSTYPGQYSNSGVLPQPAYAQQQAYVQPQPQYYPPQYYLNNYNYQNNGVDKQGENTAGENTGVKPGTVAGNNPGNSVPASEAAAENAEEAQGVPSVTDFENQGQKVYEAKLEEPQDFSKSNAVIGDLDARAKAMEDEKKNTTQKKIVALTDEYIKSLENYLNNPNDEIRLMASKEILIRLDEDKDRYDDLALNALLNKMLQDPDKLIRVAALSAFASGLASGNDFTVQLLHNIQQNPNADKEDVLQAADILLKMSAGTEVKNIPTPKPEASEVKENANVENKR